MSDNVEDLVADNSNAQDDRITWDNRLDDTVLGVEVTVNASHNSIKGSIVRDVLSRGVGNDTVDAHFGEGDRPYGGVGDDILILDFTRKAKLYGWADDDTYVLRQWTTASVDSIVEHANHGADTIRVTGATIDLNRSNLSAIENVAFTSDALGAARTVTGNTLSSILLTAAGNDTVHGVAGDDESRTGDGADWIEGGTGHDTLDGGTGNDSVLAGTGDDQVLGGDGDDALNVGDGTDFVYGGTGNDSAFGLAGNDTLSGDAGGDWLYGGAGNDRIYGGADNDRLYGKAGVDFLYGGAWGGPVRVPQHGRCADVGPRPRD